MIINPIIKHLLPDAPALPLYWAPPGTPSEEGRGLEREMGREGWDRGREGGRERVREKEGWGKRAAIQKGHQIAGFFHTGEVVLCGRINVCEVMWLQNKRNHWEEEEAGTFHQRRRIEKWKRHCTPQREARISDQTPKVFCFFFVFFNLHFYLSSLHFSSIFFSIQNFFFLLFRGTKL